MKKYVIFIFIVIELSSFAQKSPNQNINLSVGLGQTPGYYNFDSYGLAYSIVYERQILNGILFEGGNDLLLEESMPTLKTLYQELVKHPQLVIQIQGHIYDADFSWSEENQIETLSARRAKRIYEYLIFKGIHPPRLSYIGLENQFPLHKGAKYDRRVEIEIVNI